jgi:hypothetical protein
MLATNILTLSLIVVLLTIIPVLPSFVMSKVLARGLADERAERGVVTG